MRTFVATNKEWPLVMTSKRHFWRCQYRYNWCQYHDIVILVKKQYFRDGLRAQPFWIWCASLAHDGSCRQGGFWREDLVFCWCLQWKSYFVDLFGNKVDRNKHIWHKKHVVELVRMPLTAFWGSFLLVRKVYFAHKYCPPHINIEIINFTVNRSLNMDDIPSGLSWGV